MEFVAILVGIILGIAVWWYITTLLELWRG